MHYNPSPCDIVRKIPLLEKYCTAVQKSFLNRSAICYSYGKEHFIFHEEFPAHNIFFVLSGTISLWKKDIYGNKYIIRFAGKGDLLGYRGSFTGNHTYRLSATAMQDVTICSIEKDVFATVLKENLELHFDILLSYGMELEKAENRLHDLLSMNAREKVAEALLILHYHFTGKQDSAPAEESNTPFNISISRKELSSIVGLSEGRTIRQLMDFRNEKILNTSGSMITLINHDKLKEIVAKYH